MMLQEYLKFLNGSNSMTVAFFDFDGTITSRDTLIDFIRFAVGEKKFLWGMCVLMPTLIAYKLKLIPNDRAKEKMLSHYFKGMEKKEFQRLASTYSLRQIPKIVRQEALDKIDWHQKQGHKIVVVSASMECWLKPWCEKYGLKLLSTKMETVNNMVTGKFATKNCHGKEKVNRIKEKYILDNFDIVYAYGDSYGDKELLALADKPFYRAFF